MNTLELIGTMAHSLTDNQLAQLVRITCAYLEGEEIKLPKDATVKAYLNIISDFLNKEKAHKERVRKARSEAGKKGGRGNTQLKAKKAKKAIALLALESEKNEVSNTLEESCNNIDNKQDNESEKTNKAIAFFAFENKEIKKEENPSYSLSPIPPIPSTTLKEEINKEEKNLQKSPGVFDLSFIDDERFRPIFEEWLSYKREKRQTYKPKGLKTAYRRLVALSGGDPKIARREVVEFSMASNYDGLFREKKENLRQKKEENLSVNDNFNPDEFNYHQ